MKNRNMMHSYFLIKPDGVMQFKKIKEYIRNNELGNAIYFKVDNWEDLQKNIYEDHYKKVGFAESYGEFIETEKSIFGNKGIVILLEKIGQDKAFMDRVLETKRNIRNQYMKEITVRTHKKKETLNSKKYFIGKDGKVYKRVRFDLIHCPDSDMITTLREIKKLKEMNILEEKNILNEKKQIEIENADYSKIIKKFEEFISNNIEEKKEDEVYR